VLRMSREKGRSLPRRVPSADDDDLIIVAELRLDVGGGVVDPETLETRQIRERQLAILHTGRDEHGVAPCFAPSGALRDERAAIAGKRCYGLRDRDVRAKLLGLDECPPREVRSGEAGGETQVVLDA